MNLPSHPQEMQGHCILFIIAGFDTTSTLLSFLAYRLAIHPELQEKVYEEIKQHCDTEVKMLELLDWYLLGMFLCCWCC